MKKIISIVLTAVCVLALFAGCSAKAPEAAAEDGNVSLGGPGKLINGYIKGSWQRLPVSLERGYAI